MWHSVANGGSRIKADEEHRLTMEERDPHCQGLWLKERRRLNPEDSTSCLRTGCAALASHGRATKPHDDECQERIRTIIERTLTGKARVDAYKHRIAETARVKERKRARVERGAGDVLMELGNRGDEQVAVRHADVSGGDVTEKQHEDSRMRDIQIGKRGSEAASEEQPD